MPSIIDFHGVPMLAHDIFPKFEDVKIGEKDELIVNGHKIKCIQASREGPKALPWKDRH